MNISTQGRVHFQYIWNCKSFVYETSPTYSEKKKKKTSPTSRYTVSI